MQIPQQAHQHINELMEPLKRAVIALASDSELLPRLPMLLKMLTTISNVGEHEPDPHKRLAIKVVHHTLQAHCNAIAHMTEQGHTLAECAHTLTHFLESGDDVLIAYAHVKRETTEPVQLTPEETRLVNEELRLGMISCGEPKTEEQAGSFVAHLGRAGLMEEGSFNTDAVTSSSKLTQAAYDLIFRTVEKHVQVMREQGQSLLDCGRAIYQELSTLNSPVTVH